MIDAGIEGKVALVTGANSGIGAAIACALARQGAAVVLHYLESQPPAPEGISYLHGVPGRGAVDALAEKIALAGGRALPLAADLSRPAELPILFDAAERVLGPVDVLVNNAAHCEDPDSLLTITAAGFNRTFAVNARAALLLMSEYARRCRDRGCQWGRIISVSTDAALTFPGQITYGASKAALEAITRSAACELGPLGVTVNAVAPGPVQTGWISDTLASQLLPSIPLGRLGRPEDIADTVVFLASAQASWVTGQVIRVAGGHIM